MNPSSVYITGYGGDLSCGGINRTFSPQIDNTLS